MGVRRVDRAAVPDGLDAYEPCADDDQVEKWLRAPYPGYLDELDGLYQSGSPAWQASDGGRASHPYRVAGPAGAESDDADGAPIASPYRDLVILRFADHRPAGRLTPRLTAALRSAVMSRTAEPLPPAVHGHGFDGQAHVAYLALPVCGSPHADGHLVALAVAIPGMSEEDRRRVLRGILGPETKATIEVAVPGETERISLVYEPERPLPKAALAWNWVRSSGQWVSVTPIVLDRFPKRGEIEAEVARSFTLAGLPEPVDVQVSKSALTTGGVQLRPHELPKRAAGRIYRHARVWFDRPVAGPVLAGAGRYFGVGLFTPEFPPQKGGADED